MCRLFVYWVAVAAALALLPPASQARDRYFAYQQRGDQGPDRQDLQDRRQERNDRQGSLAPTHSTPRKVNPGGPNVCRTRSRSQCCPGWQVKGFTGLCLSPICRNSCGRKGKCVKPNICICEDGRVAPACNGEAADTGDCSGTCLNGGTCVAGKCACRSGYSGEFCQEPVCGKRCKNGGRCIGPNRCACVYGYTGRYCEIDYRTGPCYRRVASGDCRGQLQGVVCTRQLCCATIGVAWGHPCEECPAMMECKTGFLKNVHTGKCMDIDECEAIPGLCVDGYCQNTIGSFDCECPEGMEVNDNHECVDKDECASGEHTCYNGRCVNTDPGYTCICQPGFISTQDRRSCLDGRQGTCYTGVSSAGLCLNDLAFKLSRIDCCCGKTLQGKGWKYRQTDLCEPCPSSETAEFNVLCQEALEILQPNDIDECSLRDDLCGTNGVCVNTPNGYRCECGSGYELTAGGRCQDTDECRRGACAGGTCVNKPGGFDCFCPAGFHPSAGQDRCIDHDECGQTGMCANGKCTNSDGSFRCECDAGYALSPSGLSCIDVDECLENHMICLKGRCKNIPGSYICVCEDGFEHSADGSFCRDLNECNQDGMCANGRCVNMDGSFKCVCEPGYQLATNGKTCEDVDECLSNPCQGGRCTNSPGGYNCDCLRGFALGPDSKTCTESARGVCFAMFRDGRCINPTTSMMVSKSTCCCHSSVGTTFSLATNKPSAPLGWGNPCTACPLSGSAEFNQLCPHGEGFTNGGSDINECAQNPDICGNGACENLIGSYRCLCNTGYEVDITGRGCQDIDECAIDTLICKGGQCKNTLGSFQCICPIGTIYSQENHFCEDEDECAREEGAVCSGGICTNTQGSYMCVCAPGFQLDSTGRFCIDARKGTCWSTISAGQCENSLPGLSLKSECCCSSVGVAWGSPCEACDASQCNCPTGMAKTDGKTCLDINECSLDARLCEGGRCVNTDGSFMCICPEGLTLVASENRCVDEREEPCYLDYRLGVCSKSLQGLYKKEMCCCSIGEAWGRQCTQCPRPGTPDFAGLCGQGFGFMAGQDVNECVLFPDMCQNGRCKNSIGSYSCRCDQGYALDEDGVRCTDIDECSIMHGVCGNGTCVNTDGAFTCNCDAGFEMAPMMRVCMDVDECVREPRLCQGGRCINTPGSFQCECPAGHELTDDGRSCKDVDECSRSSGICSNGACENMMGSYQCICDEGYEQVGGGSSCQDIDECATGDNGGCDGLCINSPGAYSCACHSGYSLLLDGRTCVDIDECSGRGGGFGEAPCNGGTCINTPGSYSCVCSGGLMMGADATSCIDLDECIIDPDVCKNGKCENILGSYRCLCDDGFSVEETALEEGCVDDDECLLDIYHCDPFAECKNTNGSYDCVCREGFTGDGFSCQDINECLKDNGGCDQEAQCINTDGGFRCECDIGFSGDGYDCSDIDECSRDPSLCKNAKCVNYGGAFRCECKMGYMHPTPADEQSCVDIDECDMFDNLCVFGRCENNVGGFQCICDDGFVLDKTGGNCTDINECEDPLSCMYGECTNREGDYHCQCAPGFELLPEGNGCVDRRRGACYLEFRRSSLTGQNVCGMRLGEEVGRSACCCGSGKAWGPGCEECPTPGSREYKLVCPGGDGFKPNQETVILEDINECVDMVSLCEHGRCSNTFGSFMCTCQAGYRLDDTQMMCVDVDECAASSRGNADGSDLCAPGTCVNTDGGFECRCPADYVLSPDGKECVDMRKEQCYMSYAKGNESSSTAICRAPMSRPQTRMVCCCSMGAAWGVECEQCPTNGSPGYRELCGHGRPGLIVDPLTGHPTEIDECQLMPGTCQHGTCMNTIGSFKCECDRGYEFEEDAHQCVDRNECLLGSGGDSDSGPCTGNAECVNVPGSFYCRCPDGYRLGPMGRDCRDIDECSEQAASGAVCANGKCRNNGGSFQCICDEGFALTPNRDSCVDIDECRANPGACGGNGTCINQVGGFTCQCKTGFQLDEGNVCKDVDECRIDYTLCRHGRCKNLFGGFTCDCASGFQLSEDGLTCQDINECLDPSYCPAPGQCQNLMGSALCQCPIGFKENPARTACEDVNECLEIKDFCVDGLCNNTHGGAVCECASGWDLDPVTGRRCVDNRQGTCYDQYRSRFCLAPRPGPVSQRTCCCTRGQAWGVAASSVGSDSNGCEKCPSPGTAELARLCPLGMGRGDSGQDFNECEMMDGLCEGGTCVNTDGSYRCDCPKGFELDPSGSRCIDVDECVNHRACGNGTCTNVRGGFECACSSGYAPGSSGMCEDVNECAGYGHDCAFRCHNTAGGYKCVCPYGYMLAPDGRHCIDLDECKTEANTCRYQCKNLIGTFMCVCPQGFTKLATGDEDECEDIDECAEQSDLCGPAGRCLNTQGGYQCQCGVGYEPSSDGTSCIDHRKGICYHTLNNGRCENGGQLRVKKADCCCSMGFAWGGECEICPHKGSIQFTHLCQSSGMNSIGEDIDECKTIANLCENGQCINTLGSYRCICDRGYHPDPSRTKCADFNECSRVPNPCEHECYNTFGSYKCECPPGYILNPDGRTCRDLDECASGQHRCHHECVNTEGSYRCMCPPGYQQIGDRCLDIDECLEQQGLCPAPGTCKNTDGSFKCVCPRGYQLDGTGTFCVDLNECDDDSRCEEGCRNRAGSYRCGCPEGFQLHLYYNQCVDKDECKGKDNPCGGSRCTNTVGSFECGCPSGYQFDNGLSICIQSGANGGGCSGAPCAFGCSATGGPGGYSCQCPRGYQSIGDGHCVATVNPSSYQALSRNWDLDDYEVGKDDFISTEGCFACQMNGGGSSSRSARRRRGKRRRRHRRSAQLTPKESFLSLVKQQPAHMHSYRIDLTVRRDQTTNRQRILKLQSSRSDLAKSIIYTIVKEPKTAHLALNRKAGVWGLFFPERVRLPLNLAMVIRGEVVKGPNLIADQYINTLVNLTVV